MVNRGFSLTAAAVEQAYEVIRPFLPPTPLAKKKGAEGRRVFLKLETAQPTGSFKVRGALSNLLRQPASEAGFVAASAGNHGLGVAWAAKASGRPERVTIFIPDTAPRAKVMKLRQYSIDLHIAGQTFDDAERMAREFERDTGARFIHAYDDPHTAAGQGTVAIEIDAAMATDLPIGTLVVPVGGGGLISGAAAWFKERRPEIRIVAVQPEASPALSESIRLNRALLEYPAGPTLADGLSGGIGRIVFAHRHLVDAVVNVPETRIRAAIRGLHLEDGVRAEASGAITVGALDLEESRSWPEPIVCVITGSNIDETVFEAIVS
jgi:threonine dehydratase